MDRGDGRPRLIGDYILGPKIGSGSFAVVWRSTHRVYGWEAAIKEIDRKQLNDSLVKEITILRQINHPNIIRLHDAIETPDKIYLVLEYCTGGDLAGYIQRFGRVSEVAARHFMRQLASGLQVLRHNNLIHRDLKPQNLLLSTHDETPILKIGDFGFARYLKPQALADTLCGSPLYMAPEIIQNQKYDAKADLWSVGAILFQLVTGKPPFDGNNQFQLFQNVTSNELQFPRGVIEELNPDCVELCKSLLRRNPVERLAFEEFFNHEFLVEPRLNVDVGCSSSMQDGTTHLEHEERTSVNESKMHSSGLAYSSIPSSKSVSCFSVYDENIFMPKKELGRSNSANRKFPSEMISTVSPKELVDGGRSKSSDLQSTMTECLDQRLLAMNISEVGDSLERIEQEYVLVNAHVSSTYTLSSSLEASAQYHSADILTESSLKKTSKGKSAPLQTGQLGVSSVCGVESLGCHESASSATSVASTELVEVPGLSSSHPSARLCLLRQYALALSELAKEKLDVGLHLESFSVELVALAVWQEALRLCKCWVSSTSAADSCPSAVANEGSQDQEGEGLNFNKPSSVCSWFEQGFLVALGRAEKFYSHLRDMDANAEMPDAIEIIFQTALAAGRHGGAEELIGSRNAAVSYSKATVLLSFILTEATSLPLKPPFSLSAFDRQRLQRYIINLKSHQNRVLGLPKSPDHPCGFPK